MILIFRIFGVIAALIALMQFFKVPGEWEAGDGFGSILRLTWSIGWTIFWFWLAHSRAEDQRQKLAFLLSQPCMQCGSEASIGYRVCGSCGRVKHPELR
ncbi:hypothetical protein SAMN04489806_1108 [Paramicrobacterium humi]|uniref:Uncharacterized protein n=1 Tax=Paramicrobacterium humi TaxID=640635 RepID=A0A1H4KDJ2_9MICO|nr:hypothetical protein [Microbacterium humi]SEB56118.1 hypothetical protein SAMN04489806_1108 [Microbacterium humi]